MHRHLLSRRMTIDYLLLIFCYVIEPILYELMRSYISTYINDECLSIKYFGTLENDAGVFCKSLQVYLCTIIKGALFFICAKIQSSEICKYYVV